MSKLDEQFDKWWASESLPEAGPLTDHERRLARAGFLAGAAAREEAVLKIIADARIGLPSSNAGLAIRSVLGLIERRIREREGSE